MALVHLPLSAFYVDDVTGVIWGPDPNGSVVSPDGIRLAPQTPIATGVDSNTGDNTATYAAPTPATVQAATVTPPASSSSAAPPASSVAAKIMGALDGSIFGVPKIFLAGVGLVAVLYSLAPADGGHGRRGR